MTRDESLAVASFGDWLAASANRAAGWVAVLEIVLLSPPAFVAAATTRQTPLIVTILCWAAIAGATCWLAQRARRSASAQGPVRLLYLSVVVGLIFTWLYKAPYDGTPAWAVNMAWIVAALCVLGWPTRSALISGASLAILTTLANPRPGLGGPVGAAIFHFLLVLSTAAAFLGLRRSMTRRAEGEASARQALVEAETIASQVHIQGYWSAIVHDHVLSVLAAAASVADGQTSVRVSSDAVDAIVRLTQTPTAMPCLVGDLAKWLAETASALLPNVVVRQALSKRGQQIPGEAALALLAAGAEAMRNVERHASDPQSATVLISDDGGGVQVSICDDGPGFDPGRVPPARLGLRVAVRERMAVTGGEALISSGSGCPTVVTLYWPRHVRNRP